MVAIVDAVEYLLMHRASRQAISNALTKDYGRPPGTPIPLDTVDDWIAKAKERWREDAKLTRDETRDRQLRRLYSRLRNLKASAGSPSKWTWALYREVAILEKLIAKIEGNEAPKQIVASTPPGKPLEVKVIDPRKMSHGARQRRIAELQERNKGVAAAVGAAIAGAAGASAGEESPAEEPAEQKTGTEG